MKPTAEDWSYALSRVARELNMIAVWIGLPMIVAGLIVWWWRG